MTTTGTSTGALVLVALVNALHAAFLAFMVLAPFSSDRRVLALHLLTTPFLWLHWWLNDDTCALTLLESTLRGVEPSRCFVHAVVSPIYKVADEDVRLASWYASVGLWLVTLARVSWADVLPLFGVTSAGAAGRP